MITLNTPPTVSVLNETKVIKEKIEGIVETRGRKTVDINYPKDGSRFTVISIYKKMQNNKNPKNRPTRMTITKYFKRFKDQGLIKIIEKKIVHPSGKGRPEISYVAVKNKK